MPNADNQYGVFNKFSKDYKLVKTVKATGALVEPKEILAQNFGGNVETAKDYFLTSNAKACFDAHGTQVQFGITADGNGLCWTIAFGTKGAGTAEADDHAAKWTETKDALIAAKDWISGNPDPGQSGDDNIAEWSGGDPYAWLATDSAGHLF